MLRSRDKRPVDPSELLQDGDPVQITRVPGLVAGGVGLLLVVVVLSAAVSENWEILSSYITTGRPPTTQGTYKVIAEVFVEDKNITMQILDEPIPGDCFAEPHADYDGYAVRWGLGNKAYSAAECCRLCKEFIAIGPDAKPCNAWVWCGDPSGVCWTPDVHTHRTGDCWLKYQEKWDNNVDLATSNLKVNHRGKYPDSFRAEHKTAPEWVAWTSGVVPYASRPAANVRPHRSA